jgi:hypothetical protein
MKEAGLLLGLGPAHQAHSEHMLYGGIPHHVLHPVMGVDGNADDVFNRSHGKSSIIRAQR